MGNLNQVGYCGCAQGMGELCSRVQKDLPLDVLVPVPLWGNPTARKLIVVAKPVTVSWLWACRGNVW